MMKQIHRLLPKKGAENNPIGLRGDSVFPFLTFLPALHDLAYCCAVILPTDPLVHGWTIPLFARYIWPEQTAAPYHYSEGYNLFF